MDPTSLVALNVNEMSGVELIGNPSITPEDESNERPDGRDPSSREYWR